MSNTNRTAAARGLTVTKFWLHEGTRWSPNGARVEFADGSQVVVQARVTGTGYDRGPVLDARDIDDANDWLAPVVHALDATHEKCAGWDESWQDADEKAGRRWDEMHGEVA